MRSAQKSNRARGRGSRKGNGGGPNLNRVYESNGPEGKVRGTPQQIIDKYLSLARDAQTSGDRVNSENFLQHAEHYQRILAAALGAQQERQQQQQQQQQNQPDQDDDSDDTESDARQTPERQEAQADGAGGGGGGGGGRRRGSRGSKSDQPQPSGMQTIEADGNEGGPELIVTPEDMAASRSRKRRNGDAQAKSDASEQDTAAE